MINIRPFANSQELQLDWIVTRYSVYAPRILIKREAVKRLFLTFMEVYSNKVVKNDAFCIKVV